MRWVYIFVLIAIFSIVISFRPSITSYKHQISGGIVSHHLLMDDEIAKVFANLKSQQPSVLVIIGPNHFNVGDGDILVSQKEFQTSYGDLLPDKIIINKLLNLQIVNNDERPFVQEHSVSALVNYIKNYLPNTKIVPIIIKRGVSDNAVTKLALGLYLLLPPDAVVVASIDFSHHLSLPAANFHDTMSITAIQNLDYARIKKSEIDSPASIITLLKYLEQKGATKIYFENKNSTQIIGDKLSDDVTSYLFAQFTEGENKKTNSLSVLSFGDMMLGRNVEKILDPFKNIRGSGGNFLRGVDYISANLEGPITSSKDCSVKLYSFKFKPDTAKMIAKNGINIVNLSNNHTADCKLTGVSDTKDNLSKHHINYFGGEDIFENEKVVFIGLDITAHVNDLNKYYEKIKEIKKSNKLVIINIHWGVEYNDYFTKQQKSLGHVLIDNGADLVIGHHPHVIEPVEIYKNKAIFYSLGNFIFDQVGVKQATGLGVGTVFNNHNTQFYLFPYIIKKFQPELLSPLESETYCNDFLKSINHDGCHFQLPTAAP